MAGRRGPRSRGDGAGEGALTLRSRVALLRAVNVGGTGLLPMAELRRIGTECGFADSRTHIASGNLLFASDLDEPEIKRRLEGSLLRFAGKPIAVFVRSGDELDAIVAANPFPDAQGSRHMVFFQDSRPAPDLIAQCRDRGCERLALGQRELHVDYGEGIRTSRLKIPATEARSARNMNTVRKLAQLLRG